MHRLAAAVPLACLLLPAPAAAATFVLTHRGAGQIVTWDPSAPAGTELLHSVLATDVDFSAGDGSPYAWIVDRDPDILGQFTVGSAIGLDVAHALAVEPRHVVVHNGEIVVTTRADGNLRRYDFAGQLLGTVSTPATFAQGMAGLGGDLYVSLWLGGPSLIGRYNSDLTLTGIFSNPSGMGDFDNVFDLAHDPDSGHWFGLATTGVDPGSDAAAAILEFEMDNDVLAIHPLAQPIHGIGLHDPVVCGDLAIEGDEACDDGNTMNTDACTDACEVAVCGDGLVWQDVEDCDDADDLDTNACTSACTLAFCGDGHVWTDMEACDDGNDINDDGCTDTCSLPACGDGIVQAGEECDDPNPLLCVDCLAVPPPSDSTGDATTTGDTTTTTDATTSTTTTSSDDDDDDDTGSESSAAPDTTTDAATTTAAPHPETTTGDASTTGDAPTGDAPTSSSDATADTDDPPGASSGGLSYDDGGCGCAADDRGALAPLLGLLLVRRRRRAAR